MSAADETLIATAREISREARSAAPGKTLAVPFTHSARQQLAAYAGVRGIPLEEAAQDLIEQGLRGSADLQARIRDAQRGRG